MDTNVKFLNKTKKAQEEDHDDENEKNKIRGEITSCTSPTAIGQKKDINCELPQDYRPKYVEAAWYDWWEKQGYFRPEYYDEHLPSNTSTPRKKFTMIIRPPNVIDYLHLDFVITCTLEDTIARWRRMCGDTVLWVPGYDHADIATQVIVEKELMKEQKLTRYDLGREKFLEEVWKWKNSKGDHIFEQMKLLGSSCDWSRTVFTMDKSMSYAVEEAFIRLHEKNLIYRSTRLVNWSCTLKSAISNIEIEKIELKGRTFIHVPGYEQPVEFGVLVYFAYPIENSNEEIIVATTRLETMLGDTAVVVHPDDERYKHLQGKFVQHPFLSRRLPILTDTMVDPSFGFGAVKVNPAHDPNDFEYGHRLSLPFITCINDDGLMSSECGSYSGKPRFDVRNQLLSDLQKRGLYRESKENEMILLICSRNKDIIEPLLKPQWYVNCKTMAQRSIDVVRSKELKILPEMFERTWYQWLEDSRDWCISTHLWWGHRIPSYFVNFDDILIENEKTNDHYWISAHTYEEALDKAERRFNISKDKIRLTQDEDPMKKDDFEKFFPTTLLETSHDMLFSWVARMVMMSLELTDRLPFTEVYLHRIIPDADECKMSQTLRNVINPFDFIDTVSLVKLRVEFKSSKEDYPDGIPECGTDALRFAICDYTARDQYIDLNKFRGKGSRDFCNDIFNVIRFAMSKNLDINDSNCFQPPTEFELTGAEKPCDLWILSRLSHAIEQCESGFKKYQFHQITTTIYNFWLPELNDIYIQYVKKDFYPGKPNLEQQNRQNTIKLILYTCLNNGLRLTAPIMPYLSEELYQRLPKPNNGQNSPPSLCITPYPKSNEFNRFRRLNIEENIELVGDAVDEINRFPPIAAIPRTESITLFIKSSATTAAVFIEYLDLIQSLTNINQIQVLDEEPTPDDEEYVNIPTSGDFKLYLKKKEDFE